MWHMTNYRNHLENLIVYLQLHMHLEFDCMPATLCEFEMDIPPIFASSSSFAHEWFTSLPKIFDIWVTAENCLESDCISATSCRFWIWLYVCNSMCIWNGGHTTNFPICIFMCIWVVYFPIENIWHMSGLEAPFVVFDSCSLSHWFWSVIGESCHYLRSMEIDLWFLGLGILDPYVQLFWSIA